MNIILEIIKLRVKYYSRSSIFIDKITEVVLSFLSLFILIVLLCVLSYFSSYILSKFNINLEKNMSIYYIFFIFINIIYKYFFSRKKLCYHIELLQYNVSRAFLSVFSLLEYIVDLNCLVIPIPLAIFFIGNFYTVIGFNGVVYNILVYIFTVFIINLCIKNENTVHGAFMLCLFFLLSVIVYPNELVNDMMLKSSYFLVHEASTIALVLFLFLGVFFVYTYKKIHKIYYKDKFYGKLIYNKISSYSVKIKNISFFKLDLLTIIRNKRPLTSALQSFLLLVLLNISLVVMYSIVSDRNIIDFSSINMTIVYSFQSIIILIMNGIFLFSYYSKNITLILRIDTLVEDFLLSKYHIHVYSILFSYVLSLPFYIYLKIDIILMSSFMCYHLGVTSVIVLMFGVRNFSRLDLSKGNTFNYEAWGIKQWFLLWLPIILPVIIYLALKGALGKNISMSVIASIGLISTLFKDRVLSYISNYIIKNKYNLIIKSKG